MASIVLRKSGHFFAQPYVLLVLLILLLEATSEQLLFVTCALDCIAEISQEIAIHRTFTLKIMTSALFLN